MVFFLLFLSISLLTARGNLLNMKMAYTHYTQNQNATVSISFSCCYWCGIHIWKRRKKKLQIVGRNIVHNQNMVWMALKPGECTVHHRCGIAAIICCLPEIAYSYGVFNNPHQFQYSLNITGLWWDLSIGPGSSNFHQ